MKGFWYNKIWHSVLWIEIRKTDVIAHLGQWESEEKANNFPDDPDDFLIHIFPIETAESFDKILKMLVAEDGPFANATDEKPLDPIDEMQILLDEVTSILTDEQADQIPQAFSEWKTETAYSIGQRVRYNDELWRCIQAHTSQEGWEPSETPSLWTRTHQEDEIPEWTQPLGAGDAYSAGDKVKHLSKTWESTVDDNVWEPGVYGWTEVTE